MASSDAELDQAKRATQIQQLDKILRDRLHEPSARTPSRRWCAWRPDQVAGPDRPVHQQPGKQLLEHVGLVEGVAETAVCSALLVAGVV